MAQSKTTTKKKSTSGKADSGRNTAAAQPAPPAPPHTREIGGVVLLLLTAFVVISFFNTDGAVIAFIADLFKGLLGWGYYLTAPVFLIAAILLFSQKDKPVALRVTASMLLPIVFGAIASLFFYDSMRDNFQFQAAVVELFSSGQELKSGGVLGGLVGAGMDMAFSIFGAVPILGISFVILLIIALRGNLSGLFSGFKTREKKYKEPKVKAEPVFDVAEAPQIGEKSERPEKKRRRKADDLQNTPKIQRFTQADVMMDVPLGDEEESLGFNDLDFKDTFDEIIKENGKKSKKRSGKDTKKEKTPFPTMEEAENLSGTELERRFKSFPTAGLRDMPEEDEEKLKPITMSAEITDPPKSKKIKKAEVEAEARNVASEIAAAPSSDGYKFPPIELLRSSSAGSVDAREEIMLNRDRLESAIRSFGISAAIVGVTRGPTVTRYDVELDQGVKLSKITNLAGDLALALGVINVRIAPIPDKISTVGIEVPNKIVSTVFLRDVIDSPKFQNAKSKLSFAIGKDISGECIIGNIAKLPHMLIAGTTGSGKSVCMNSLILSLLYKARPDEVRLIMIDPKMVELGIYNGIPHLLVPVVTDPKKAAGALQWSVVEMLKRYRLFSEVGVRDLTNYNKHCTDNGEETLPRVVIVIDELADLMMAASKEVEESICRVAQMGRAAGMHLVIATQRPSADVITGLMKANIPSRIAFAVSSAMESRIILDQTGAEKLIGMGDMLFAPVGCGKPVRIQGAFVSDEEREEVIQFIKDGSPQSSQNDEIEEFMNKAAEDKNSDSGSGSSSDSEAFSEYDEMLPHAVEVILETGSCSVSMLQRRVKLGYSRAARIVDQMEELGIVGPYEGAKPRQVLIDRAGWYDIQKELGLVNDDDMSLAAEMSVNSDYD